MPHFCNTLAKTIDFLLIGGGIIVCSVVFINVVSRYLLNVDLAFVNEFGETIFVWLTFLGSARAVRSYSHLAVVEFIEHIPVRVSRLLFMMLWALTLIMLAGLVWFGSGIAIANMNQFMSVTGWPVGVVYWAMPLGSAVALIFVLEQIIRGDDFRALVAASYSVVEE
jgi:TRAP-type C4-dicarboxylate transport system permease small subunit